MTTAIVTTTIRRPIVLADYLENLARYGHGDTEVIVIGDRRTPPDVGGYLGGLSADTGVGVDYWDVDRQRQFLHGLPVLDALLPYDSIQRRNLGYIVAAGRGHPRIISIDDDNWPPEGDFVGGHGIVGTEAEAPGVSSSTGWFNSAGLLRVRPRRPLYHRGFPTSRRGRAGWTFAPVQGRVVVNVGLWSGVPDADAMTHLDGPVAVTGFRRGVPTRVAVTAGTGVVFNTQNTAFHRDLLPCMFLPPMGGRIGALRVGRHDDVWMSIFLKKVVDHMGDLICVGEPLTEQRRNPHDLFADLLVELPALRLTNRITDTLEDVVPTGSDYRSCFLGVVEDMRSGVGSYPPDERAYMLTMLDRMALWGLLTERVSG